MLHMVGIGIARLVEAARSVQRPPRSLDVSTQQLESSHVVIDQQREFWRLRSFPDGELGHEVLDMARMGKTSSSIRTLLRHRHIEQGKTEQVCYLGVISLGELRGCAGKRRLGDIGPRVRQRRRRKK